MVIDEQLSYLKAGMDGYGEATFNIEVEVVFVHTDKASAAGYSNKPYYQCS
jgi:hypothetical protein